MKRISTRGKLVALVVMGLFAYGVSISVLVAGGGRDGDVRGGRMNRGNGRFGDHMKKMARGKMGMLMSRLTDDERKELAELRKTDKEAFRKKIREFVKKYKKQCAQEQKELKELAEKIRKAESEDEKNKLKEELRAKLRKQFDAKMAIYW